MKKNSFNYSKIIVFAIASMCSISACKKDDDQETVTPTPVATDKSVVEVKDSITADKTFDKDSIYLIKGYLYVTNNATLTIEAGTIVKGDKATKATLVIKRGSKINAVGTVANPIVFTSNEAAGSRSSGDWGGVVILGKAPVNQGTDILLEGGAIGSEFVYGGNDAADNSGILNYVRIEFGGIALQPNKEINGLTLAGVGSGTQIDYVQVSYSGDDSYEWFGGNVNAKHIIAFKGVDDDFDTDFGFSGKVQFAVGLRSPNIADVSGSNGFESDNDANSSTLNPFTSAQFSNVSLFGPMATSTTTFDVLFKRGAHLRRNTKQSIYNSVIAGYPDGLTVDGASTEMNAVNNELQFKNNVIAGCTNPAVVTPVSGMLVIADWLNNNNNAIYTDNASLELSDPFKLTNPNFLPLATSPLLIEADFTGLTGFDLVTYRGAFGTTNWTNGWSNFDPQNAIYK